MLNHFIEQLESTILSLFLYSACFLPLGLLMTPMNNKDKNKEIKNFQTIHSTKNLLHKDFKTELSYFLINNLLTHILIKLALAYISAHIFQALLPHQAFASTIQALPTPIQIILGLIIADAAFFFPHWFQHKFMWPVHSIHHSATELHWLTALRLHPLDDISFALGGALAMHLLGFEGQGIIYAIMIHNIYNVFVHANFSLEYPKPLRYILGSPNYHRWHHATDKEAIDKNLATMFPIFDLIFGSYYHPEGKLPKAYGLSGAKARKAFPKTLTQQLIYPFKNFRKG